MRHLLPQPHNSALLAWTLIGSGSFRPHPVIVEIERINVGISAVLPAELLQ
jgi:hypothetical protein